MLLHAETTCQAGHIDAARSQDVAFSNNAGSAPRWLDWDTLAQWLCSIYREATKLGALEGRRKLLEFGLTVQADRRPYEKRCPAPLQAID